MADGAPVYGPEARALDQLRHEQDDVVGGAWMFGKTGSWGRVFWAMIACDLLAAFIALLWLKPVAARTIARAEQMSLQQQVAANAKGAAAGG